MEHTDMALFSMQSMNHSDYIICHKILTDTPEISTVSHTSVNPISNSKSINKLGEDEMAEILISDGDRHCYHFFSDYIIT